MRIGILSGRRSVGGMEREAACLARLLLSHSDRDDSVWFFQNDAQFWAMVPENNPSSWFDLEGLELVGKDGLVAALIESDVVFMLQAAVLDTEELAPYINAVPFVCEMSGVMPKFLRPHKLLRIDKYLTHMDMAEEQAEMREEPLEKVLDWPGNPVWVESAPASVREVEWLTFGCLSRQDYIKKLGVLIDAFRGIEGEHKLVLVGDGHDGEKLRTYAADDDRISFPGMVNDRGEVERWFKSFDVFVMTSDWEGSAQSVKEAMALGIPCIVSDGGGTPALVGDAAVIVPVDDVLGVRSAMLDMIDIGRRHDYRERGLKRIEYLGEWAERVLDEVLVEVETAPRISIITPVGPRHNKLVVEAVESVAGQSFWPLEMVVVSDGANIDAEALSDYEFVELLHMKDNSGGRPGIVRNVAAGAARGKLILPLDADDLILPEAIVDLYKAWRRNPVGVKYGGTIKENAAGQCEYSMPREFDIDRAKKGGVHNVSALFPKCVWECIGGFPEDDIGFEDSRFYAIAGTVFGGERVDIHVIVYRHYTGERWRADKEQARLRHGPQDRAAYYSWIQNKLKEVYVMGCPGCGGRRSSGGSRGNRGAGIVMGGKSTASGSLSGMSEPMVAVEYLGKGTRYHVDSRVRHGVHYRFGERGRDRVKYVLQGDLGWMLDSGLFGRYGPPAVDAATVKPQPMEPVPVRASPEAVVTVAAQIPLSGPLEGVNLPPQIRALLIAEGFDTVEKIQGATLEQLTNIRGVGRRTVKQIRGATADDSSKRSESSSNRVSDVEVDESDRTRARPRRPFPEDKEAGRRTRPRRRSE